MWCSGVYVVFKLVDLGSGCDRSQKKYTLSDASRALCWGFGATKLDAPLCGTHLQQAGLSGHASVCWSVFWQLDRGRLESQQRRKAHEGTPSSQRLAISLLMLSHAQS
jgi:hypothetical protein